MSEARRNEVHNQRVPILQPGADHQRRGCRRHREGERQGFEDRLDADEPELGAKLAIQFSSCGTVTLL